MSAPYRAGYTRLPKLPVQHAKSRATTPGMPAFKPPKPPGLPPLGPIALTRAQTDINAQLGALPSAATIQSPYESQIGDIKGLTSALIQHLQNASTYQTNLATALPQHVASQAAQIAQQAAGQAGIVGGAAQAPPTTTAAAPLAAYGTSFANQLESQAAAAPMAAAAYDAQTRRAEQDALAKYLLQPAAQINAQLPQLEQSYQQQLQAQRNADRSFGYQKSQAAEQKREFGVSQATSRAGIEANAKIAAQAYGLKVADTTGYLPNGQPTAATLGKQLDRKLRVKLATIQQAGANKRAHESAAASIAAAGRANQREGRAAWSNALHSMYGLVDKASTTKQTPGRAGSSKVTVVYTPPKATIAGQPDPTASPPKPTTKTFPDMATYAAWRKAFYSNQPGGKINKVTQTSSGTPGSASKPVPYQAAVAQATQILKAANQTYGLGFSDGYIQQQVRAYANPKYGALGLLPKQKRTK